MWIYTRNINTWTLQQKLVGSGYTGASAIFQGNSCAISADGNTVAFGGYGDNSNQGAVWVFTRNNNTWTQQGTKLTVTGNTGAPQIGFQNSLSMSADGNTIAVGGLTDNSNLGATWIFTRTNGVWSQQGNKLIGANYTGASVQQGQSTSLSSDGNILAVGGVQDYTGLGAVWMFTRDSNGIWTQQGNKLIGSNNTGTQNIFNGYTVSLSADGNTLAEAGFGDNSNAGAVWIFTRINGVWSQQGPKLVGTNATGTANQGRYVTLSGDGNTLYEGGIGDNGNIGAIWVFTRQGGILMGNWIQKSKISPSVPSGNSQYGTALSSSSDGNTLVVGGPQDNAQNGAMWSYV